MTLYKVQRFYIEIPKNLQQENLWYLESMHILKTNFPEIKMVFERHVFNWIKNCNWILKSRVCLRLYYIKQRKRKRKIGVFTTVNISYVLPIWIRPKSIDERKKSLVIEKLILLLAKKLQDTII